MPRYFLFGTVEVPMWDYYWGLTAAQVELLTIDQPIVVYKKEKKDAPWKDGKVSEDYANKQYRKWLERKKQREREGKKIDIAGTFANAKKLDMKTLLETGEKKEIE